MTRYSLFVLKVPLNTNQLTNSLGLNMILTEKSQLVKQRLRELWYSCSHWLFYLNKQLSLIDCLWIELSLNVLVVVPSTLGS